MESGWLEALESEVGGGTQGKVLLKLECDQKTGSFCARGALNKLLSLKYTRDRYLITASSGNFACGIAHAMNHIAKTSDQEDIIQRMETQIYLPEQANYKALEERLEKVNP